jgi:hypothetical protein
MNSRGQKRDHVARLERRAGLCFDTFLSAQPVNEQPDRARASAAATDKRGTSQPIGAQLEFPPMPSLV